MDAGRADRPSCTDMYRGRIGSMKISVILPSLNPDGNLMLVVKGLIDEGFDDIIIVNDGSDEAHMEPFVTAGRLKEVTVLTHEVNKGKGRALKTAFEYCAANRPDIDGVVTVDGDNQHRPADIRACCEAMMAKGDKVILGCRDFAGSNVPPKSKVGNNITKFVFRFACGIKITDTQTGLRAIPAKYLDFMTKVKGERFEYETQMLLEMNREGIEFDEVTIETVYIEENTGTHFHWLRDSVKIYMVILKFIFSSIMSFVIDYLLFLGIELLIGDRLDRWAKVLIATVGARIVSSLFNFTFNRKAVFNSKTPISKSMPKYYVLCVCQAGVSYGLVYLISDVLKARDFITSLIKMLVDVILFILSFQIQRKWVFAVNKREGTDVKERSKG